MKMDSAPDIRKQKYLVERKAMELNNLETIKAYSGIMYEMANYQSEDSGLPYDIWFDEEGKTRVNKHSLPRVKVVMDSGNMIPVSVDEKPKILLKGTLLTKAELELTGRDKKKTLEFISRNHRVILRHWGGEITTKQLFELLDNE